LFLPSEGVILDAVRCK